MSLYGPNVLPEDLVDFYNYSILEMKHVSSSETLEQARGAVFALLHRYVIQIEDHPTTTRFWTFSSCVCCLLRMKLLGLPSDAFALRTVTPNEANSKRLSGFKAFFNDVDTGPLLRRVALPLRLTQFATEMKATKRKS